jgi:hypothetical protein
VVDELIGLGALDEMTDMLTLAQTQNLERALPVILYGSEYWREVINFDALVRHGMSTRRTSVSFGPSTTQRAR